jgi:hypothetical protein
MLPQNDCRDCRHHARAIVFAALALSLHGCSRDSPANGPSPPASAANRAPVVASLNVSPSGIGLQSATIFTFTGQGVIDPDGDAVTHSWTSTDGAAIISSTQAASHVYARSGVFEMRLTVTDARGLSTSAIAAVDVRSLTGTWDVACDNRPASFPSQFVVVMTQNDASLFGTISGGGLTEAFPAPAAAASVNAVRDPRQVVFGVETLFNVWASRDGDFYFHLSADDTLNGMTGSSQYCGVVSARRR